VKNAKTIQNDFHSHYETLYGDRWAALTESLHAPEKKVTFNGYQIDPASVIVAAQVPDTNAKNYLDLCAAPGGKSLLTHAMLKKQNVSFHMLLNELSIDRIHKLHRVLDQHCNNWRHNVAVHKSDGSQFGIRNENRFDVVLVDAPCSGERHYLQHDKDLSEWKLSRSTGLSKRQYALLCSSLLALKSGGKLIYSTCSLSPIENDHVIERFLKRKPQMSLTEITQQAAMEDLKIKTSSMFDSTDQELILNTMRAGEKTTYGWQFLPDRASGAGPMYFAVMTKTNTDETDGTFSPPS
jgi:16S rRNA C967 or C1407 C5-methylase (RsmB/RsmF family)